MSDLRGRNLDAIHPKTLFKDWVDADIGESYLACMLGLMEYDDGLRMTFTNAKGVFNTENRVGDALCMMFEQMVEGGIFK